MQTEEEVLTRIAVKQKIGRVCGSQSQETFLRSILPWEHHRIKKNESAVFTSIYIQFQSVTEAAQPELKAFLTEAVALLLQLLQVTLV